MKTKATNSKMCVLLAILFFLNPVIASADALFSTFSSIDIALSSSDIVAEIPCHEEKSARLLDEKKVSHSDMESDSCADFCHCDDSGCHASSLIFNFKSQFIFNTQQDNHFQLPIYLSLTFTPSSPPPIV